MNTKWKKQFITVYIGQAFSIIGSSIVQFAIIWWITLQTESAMSLTFASIAALAPSVFFGPFAGVWVDRYNRKIVMIMADGLVALSSVGLALAFFWMQVPPLWLIYLVLFVRGIGNTFHGPAMQAAIPTLVPAEMLTKAGGWGNLINSLSNMLGPVLGGLLMERLPIATLMTVDVVGAIFAIICLLFVTIPNVARTSDKLSVFSDMRQGLLALKNNKPLFDYLPTGLLCNILFNPLSALLPLFVRTHFLGEAWHNGVVRFMMATGVLISSLVLGIWGGMKKRFLMMNIGMFIIGGIAMYASFIPPEGFWIFVVCCFLLSATTSFVNIPLMSYMQETIAPDMLGKVLSLISTLFNLALPIGLLFAGPLSEVVGISNWFLLSGCSVIFIAIYSRRITRRHDDETMLKVQK